HIDHAQRLVVYSALLGVIATLYENSDRAGAPWVVLAVRLTTPLLIGWCVLGLLWMRLLAGRKLDWIRDVQALPGWLALLVWAGLGMLAVLLGVVAGFGVPLVRIAREGGVVLVVLTPVLLVPGKKLSARASASDR
ncbi:MAG TPA: hypothetical protein VI356_25505, partial [Myxococcales bacterium]